MELLDGAQAGCECAQAADAKSYASCCKLTAEFLVAQEQIAHDWRCVTHPVPSPRTRRTVHPRAAARRMTASAELWAVLPVT